MARAKGTVRPRETMAAAERQHWLFVSARVYTQHIRRYFFEGDYVTWSSHPDLRLGDLVLVYEMGKPERRGDVPGRKQVGWVMQAISDTRKSRRRRNWPWEWQADFLGMPIAHPRPLAEMKRDRGFREWRGGSLQGGGGQHLMPDNVWVDVMKRLDRRNPGLAERLAQPGEVSFDRIPVDPVEELDELGTRMWRRERLLIDEVADLIDREGWAGRPDAENLKALGLAESTEHGYHLRGTGWYVDDLLVLGPGHLLVVEYELHADGSDRDGAQQASDYVRELRKGRRGWTVDGLVIAESFAEAEFDTTERLDIECLQANIDKPGRVQLSAVGRVRGPVAEARERAKVRRRRSGPTLRRRAH